MYPDDEEEEERFVYGYIAYRGSCEEASRFEARPNSRHVQKVYPVEHGMKCQGHWQYAPPRITDKTPYHWFSDSLPPTEHRGAVMLDVDERYL